MVWFAWDDEYEEYARMFLRESKVAIPFPVSSLVPPVLQGFSEFLKGPLEVHEQWGFDEEARGDPDLGLIRREGAVNRHGIRDDEKTFFHYRPSLWEHLDQAGLPYQQYMPWLSACDALYKRCSEVQRIVARALDELIPHHYFYEMVCDSRAQRLHVLRLLAYINAYGKTHQDRGLWTIHLTQTQGRSPLLLGEAKKPYHSRKDTALFFAGKKLSHYTGGRWNPKTNFFDGGFIPALIHGIEEEPDEAHGGEMRYAATFFGHNAHFLPGKN